MLQNLNERILSYIRTNRQARVFDLVRVLAPISRVAVHRRLKKMVEGGILKKNGTSPLVFYLLREEKMAVLEPKVGVAVKQVIDRRYLYISPQGELLYGFFGFIRWVENIHQTGKIASLASSYVQTVKEYEKFRQNGGWLDATFKLQKTFETNYISKLLYADFYSLPQFGKTALGALMLYAKQSQNRELMAKIWEQVRPMVRKIIKQFKIEAVAFIPPSVPRTVQFMSEFAAGLHLALPQITLVKARTGQVVVPQKTLERLDERVANARETIFVIDQNVPYKNILLIDDAVGSGASMNEVAKKINAKVYGFAVAGSFKGFEVIKEV